MKLSLPSVISFDKTTTDFNNWNSMQNRYECKTRNLGPKYPKTLLNCVWKEFCRRCEEYHINAAKYIFCEITDLEGRWQIDFMDQADGRGAKISIHSIIFSAKKKVIYQCIFSI